MTKSKPEPEEVAVEEYERQFDDRLDTSDTFDQSIPYDPDNPNDPRRPDREPMLDPASQGPLGESLDILKGSQARRRQPDLVDVILTPDDT